jgi:hypothetical protein
MAVAALRAIGSRGTIAHGYLIALDRTPFWSPERARGREVVL